MIYSSTIFLNEFDLLDVKIAEESPHVDKIYITESPLTFTGNPKPLNFPVEKYKDNDKIVYLVTPKEMYKDCKVAWDREFLQRNYAQTIIQFADDDICFVTDVDEIISGYRFPDLIKDVIKHRFIGMIMNTYGYWINAVVTDAVWEPPFAAVGSLCKQHSFQNMRNRNVGGAVVIRDCGKHFSYLGGDEAIRYKLKSFSHVESSGDEWIAYCIKNYHNIEANANVKIVPIDESYPKSIRDNLDKWEKYIRR